VAKRKLKPKDLLWTALVVFIFFAAAELLSRLVVQIIVSRHYPQTQSGFRHGDQTLEYDPELGWTVDGMEKLGPELPDGEAVPSDLQHKAEGTFRIFIIGDSVAYGVGVPGSRTFGALVAQGLEQRDPDRSYEVLNAAVPGYNLTQMAARLERDVLPNSPDLVIVCAGPFDAEQGQFEGLTERSHSGETVRRLQSVLFHSRLYYLLSLAVVKARHEITDSEFRTKASPLETIDAMLADADVPHVFVAPVEVKQDRSTFMMHIHQWYSSSGLAWVDIYPALQSALDQQGFEAVFIDYEHFNEQGHRIVAEQILQYLDGPGSAMLGGGKP